jgi:hypothetical protein
MIRITSLAKRKKVDCKISTDFIKGKAPANWRGHVLHWYSKCMKNLQKIYPSIFFLARRSFSEGGIA